MKNIDNNDFSKYKKKEKEDYISGDEKSKQSYWTSHIWKLLREYQLNTQTHDPELINISDFRNEYREMELNFDRFLPGILKDLQSFYGDEGNPLEIIFILDEQAKKALEVQSNLDNNLGQVNNVLKKTNKIEGIDISHEELAERIGDLYYDSLSSFISILGNNIQNNEIKELLVEASKNILNAWDICKPEVKKYLVKNANNPEKTKKYKHTQEVKGINMSNEELAKRISNLVDSELKDFLEKLSIKINKDGDIDYYRKPDPRKKLGTELYACAEKLENASKKLN